MTRVARVLSELGHYHVMVKGCAEQLIFEDDDDRYYFLNLMNRRFTSDHIRLLAWCLMDNHVHLLFDDPDNQMSTAMHAIDTAYAMRFNLKTGRRGPVFQERFKSVVISDDEQLLRCVRYIHDNPAKAGISSAPMYRWSSFHEYFGTPEICDCSDIVELLVVRRRFTLQVLTVSPILIICPRESMFPIWMPWRSRRLYWFHLSLISSRHCRSKRGIACWQC